MLQQIDFAAFQTADSVDAIEGVHGPGRVGVSAVITNDA